MGKSVVIIGGGIAGLAAACRLENADVILLEAKDRFGGRIQTIKEGNEIVELGAEFVHGKNPSLIEAIGNAHLWTKPVSDRNYLFENGEWKAVDVWKKFGELTERIKPAHSDESFVSFLDRQQLPESDRAMLLAFATGFNAAHGDRLSVHSLKRAEFSSEQIEGDVQGRIDQGYGALVASLVKTAEGKGVRLITECEVSRVRWKNGKVEVITQRGGKPEQFKANAAIITLPLGVLKRGSVVFEPPLLEKQEAIGEMQVGNAIKATFVFRRTWWERGDFGFVHALDQPIVTWWSDARGPVLTGWAGGRKADALLEYSAADLRSLGLQIMSDLFSVSKHIIEKEMINMHTHNWAKDLQSCGAYSYIPVNGLILPKLLAAPVDNTLFFAGEATATDAQMGTVFAAIETGNRAADELNAALPVT